MPLHLQSIIKEEKQKELFERILSNYLHEQEHDAVFVSEDNKHILMRKDLTDSVSGKIVGSLIYTIENKELTDSLSLLDTDIVIENDKRAYIRFLNLRDGSSDANEYYEAEYGNGNHFELETVNRYAVNGRDLIGLSRYVSLSAFPFDVYVFNDISEYNEVVGYTPEDGGALAIGGFADDFIAPGYMFTENFGEEAVFSHVHGVVKDCREAKVDFFGMEVPFTIVWLKTGAGMMPAAMSRDVFDLSELAPGKVIVMRADIKADMANKRDFDHSLAENKYGYDKFR